jgi:hypothetical protein
MRNRVLGEQIPADPVAGSFADGVANQAIVDAVRASSVSRAWQDIPPF